MGKSVVSIVKTPQSPSEAQIREAVEKAILSVVDVKDILPEEGFAIVNPNVLGVPMDAKGRIYEGACTDPLVCKAIIDVVKSKRPKARVAIAESSAVGVDTEKGYEATGYLKLREQGYEVIDLKKTKPVKVEVPGARVFKDITVFEPVLKADLIIQAPKLKTHDQCEMSLSIKGAKGLYTDAMKRRAHRLQLAEQVGDLNLIVGPKTKLVVTDGILGQEGLGPFCGIPIEMDLIIAANNIVANDAVCASVAGYEPGEVACVKEAVARGLGTMDLNEIEVVGQSIASVARRFIRPFEDKRTEIKNFELIIGEASCTGCRNNVASALYDIRFSYECEDDVAGLTVVVGDAPIPEGVSEDKLVTIGYCVPKENRRGRFVKGCPASTVWVSEAMLNRSLKRSYATEDVEH